MLNLKSMYAKVTNIMAKTKPTDSNSITATNYEFDFDPALMGEEFNVQRIPRLPYAIVINDNSSGIFLPEKNAIKAGWINLDSESVSELELASGEKHKGLFLDSCRMVILGSVKPYIRYRNNDDNGDMRSTIIGLYEDFRDTLDKKTMEVCSEHLVIFLAPDNSLLHTRPIRIRFKNVALWSLRESLEDYYIAMEMMFAKLAKVQASSKNDRWRSLCVFEAQFKGVKEGEGSNKSYCCKIESFTMPTIENFQSLFLGVSQKRADIWEAYDMNISSLQLALPESKQLLLRSAE